MNYFKFFKKIHFFLISFIVCLTIVGCDGGGGTLSSSGSSGSAATLQSIAIAVVGNNTNSTASIRSSKLLGAAAVSNNSIYIPVGTSQNIAAYGVYSDNSVKDLTSQVTWALANTTAVGSITADGEVVTTAPGSTTVTATLGSISGTASLTVTSASLVSISVTPYAGMSESVPVGLSDYYYKAVALYDNGQSVDVSTAVTWSSSSPNVAKIDAYGYITAVSFGTTEIMASYNGHTASLQFTVTGAKLISITVSSTASSLPLGSTESFAATGAYTNGETHDITNNVTWDSSDTSIASFDSAALNQLHSWATGTAKITASLGGITSSPFTVNTMSAVLMSIELTSSEVNNSTIVVGAYESFKAIGTYSNGQTLDISSILSWTSSDTSVATVDNTGKVHSINDLGLVGKPFTITATLKTGLSASTTLIVTPVVITLLADQESGVVGVPITFKAIGNNGVDVTNDMNWSVNGDSIESNVYTPNESGVTVTVTAIDPKLPGVQINTIVLSIDPKEIQIFIAKSGVLVKPVIPVPLPWDLGTQFFFFANYKDSSHHTFLPISDVGAVNFTYTVADPTIPYLARQNCYPASLVPSGYSALSNCMFATTVQGVKTGATSITFVDNKSGVSTTYPVVVVN